MRLKTIALSLSCCLLVLSSASPAARQDPPAQESQTAEPRFKSAIDLVNVTATVTDRSGRYVSGLTRDDFKLYDNDVLQPITQFSSERVPVSVGLVIDTSGSMRGDKIKAARTAVERILSSLQDPDDEFFLSEFNRLSRLRQEWTKDRSKISQALNRLDPDGGTALYDAVATAIPIASTGRNIRKAIIVLSDGNEDGSSRHESAEIQRLIRENDVMVYAVGLDGNEYSGPGTSGTPYPPPSYPPIIPRFPFPGPRAPRGRPGVFRSGQFQWPPQNTQSMGGSGVNAKALRGLTDDSGGRTEIVRRTDDLSIATTNIADELSRQYWLGYAASEKKDGKWHVIRVVVGKGNDFRVRARRGYFAS